MRRAVGSHKVRVRWWRTKVAKYLPKAYAMTHSPHPRPMDIPHDFSCAFVKGGPRFWAFSSVEARDKFVKYFAGSQSCEDPHP